MIRPAREKLCIGCQVNHIIFGIGTVIDIEERKEGQVKYPSIVTIKFDNPKWVVTDSPYHRNSNGIDTRRFVDTYINSEYFKNL